MTKKSPGDHTHSDPEWGMSGSLFAGCKKYKFSDTLENGRNGTYRVGIGSDRVGMGYEPSARVGIGHPGKATAIYRKLYSAMS